MLAAHRERAAQLVPDTTISAANIAKKIGKGERESELCILCLLISSFACAKADTP